MSKFYVGQRVRVIKVSRAPILGCLATITALDSPGLDAITKEPFSGHYILVDGHLSGHCTGVYCSPVNWIEPIYDGDQPAAFDASIWQPKHDTVRT
jgi:hypothetical protein